MKRIVAAFVVALLVSLGVAACGGGGGGSASQTAFCGLLKDSSNKLGNGTNLTDAQSQTALLAVAQSLQNTAPSEIKGDVKSIADALAAFIQKGTVPDTSKLETAYTNLTVYAKDKCGVDLGTGTSDSSGSGSSSSSGTSSSSEQAAAGGNSQLCKDLESVGSGSTSSDELSQLRSINPPSEIKDAWSDYVDGLEALSKGNFNDAGLAQRFSAAAAKVTQYVTSSCAGLSSEVLSSLSDDSTSS